MPPSKASERVRRLLTIVPYVVAHPGAEIPALCEKFEISEKELQEDLTRLFMTGLPPYTPDALVDVDMEGGRVTISFAEHFAQPLHLTRAEALSLYLRAEALLGIPGTAGATALASAVGKLEAQLGADVLSSLAGRIQSATSGEPNSALETVREAVDAHRRVEIDYYSATANQTTTRAIDPEHAFAAMGHWYIVAWDDRSDEERMFRADRIKAARPLNETFQPRGLSGVGRPLYARSSSDVSVHLLLKPGARWVAEYYEVESSTERPDGLEVTLPTRNLGILARLVLRSGGQIEVLNPAELREHAAQLGREILERYVG